MIWCVELHCVQDTLETLYAQNNSIGLEGAEAFAEMLKVNQALGILDFRSNPIGTPASLLPRGEAAPRRGGRDGDRAGAQGPRRGPCRT